MDTPSEGASDGACGGADQQTDMDKIPMDEVTLGSEDIGFEGSIEELIESLRKDLPIISQFEEFKELAEHFHSVEEKFTKLTTERIALNALLKQIEEMFPNPKRTHCTQTAEVLNISDDDEGDDVQIVSVSTTSAGQPEDLSKRQAEQEGAIQPHIITTGDKRLVSFTPVPRMRMFGLKPSGWWCTGELAQIVDPHLPLEKRQYLLNFDNRTRRTLTGKEVALVYQSSHLVKVGSRVCAKYQADSTKVTTVVNTNRLCFASGVVAEPSLRKTNYRLLVFFEDGHTQYCHPGEVFQVLVQSKEVWNDINQDSQGFIKDYLNHYPQLPMLRLAAGQMIKIEYLGKWQHAEVLEVDASLVKMYFQSDGHIEWIYRGSTRLEILYHNQVRKEHLKQSKHVIPQNNPTMTGQKHKPVVEYPRIDLTESDTEGKTRSVAKKRTTSTDFNKFMNKLQGGSKTSSHALSAAGSVASTSKIKDDTTDSSTGKLEFSTSEVCKETQLPFGPHRCIRACRGSYDDKKQHKGENPLLIPMKCGWERHVSKLCTTTHQTKIHILYQAPCGRRLRSFAEVSDFLIMTDSSLTIDLFCFDANLHTHSEFLPTKTICGIDDIAYSFENVPLPCVNAIDKSLPKYTDYRTVRKPTTGVNLNLDPDFLVCCSCTDFCRDASKCECIQLTVEAATAASRGKRDLKRGYSYRLLKRRIISGIYECNSRCKCDKRCHNRVVQNGLERKLQVYKTTNRGWGIRCLNDIPAGGFICYYTGEILTSNAANEEGSVFGDEYLAEMDYIEVVEREKEGYESEVESDPSWQDSSSHGNEDESSSASDSDYKGGKLSKGRSANVEKRMLPSRTKRKAAIDRGKSTKAKKKTNGKTKPSVPGDACKGTQTTNFDIIVIDDSDEDEGPNSPENPTTPKAQVKKSSRFKNLPDPKLSPLSPGHSKSLPYTSVRSLYRDRVDVYVIDAKTCGNLGRYLNHSCSPNLFVQNVFIDTQDPRFPWVAFFAAKHIRAGSELTWDYNYTVDSVPGKVLFCYCGSNQCRGRLL